jgi:hypothetical protein
MRSTGAPQLRAMSVALARPRRDGAEARRHQQVRRAVDAGFDDGDRAGQGQQPATQRRRVGVGVVQPRDVDMFGFESRQSGAQGAAGGQQLVETEWRERAGAAE